MLKSWHQPLPLVCSHVCLDHPSCGLRLGVRSQQCPWMWVARLCGPNIQRSSRPTSRPWVRQSIRMASGCPWLWRTLGRVTSTLRPSPTTLMEGTGQLGEGTCLVLREICPSYCCECAGCCSIYLFVEGSHEIGVQSHVPGIVHKCIISFGRDCHIEGSHEFGIVLSQLLYLNILFVVEGIAVLREDLC